MALRQFFEIRLATYLSNHNCMHKDHFLIVIIYIHHSPHAQSAAVVEHGDIVTAPSYSHCDMFA